MKELIFKTVKRICLTCKKEYQDNTGCVICPECQSKREALNKILPTH